MNKFFKTLSSLLIVSILFSSTLATAQWENLRKCGCGAAAEGLTFVYFVEPGGEDCCNSYAASEYYGFITAWEPDGEGQYVEVGVSAEFSDAIQSHCCNQ